MFLAFLTLARARTRTRSHEVFRNETMDATHLCEFHQCEGFVADRNLGLRDLIGVIKTFFEKIGIPDVRFKPAFNPYTEPSMEIFGYHVSRAKRSLYKGHLQPLHLFLYCSALPTVLDSRAVARTRMPASTATNASQRTRPPNQSHIPSIDRTVGSEEGGGSRQLWYLPPRDASSHGPSGRRERHRVGRFP